MLLIDGVPAEPVGQMAVDPRGGSASGSQQSLFGHLPELAERQPLMNSSPDSQAIIQALVIVGRRLMGNSIAGENGRTGLRNKRVRN